MRKPGFQLLWKAKLENQPRQLESLTQPMLLPNIISYKGFKALAFVGGSSDNVYSIDYDLNKMFWKRHLNTMPAGPGTIACPGAMTTITRATPLGQTTPPAGRGGPAPAPGGGGGGGRGGNTNVYAISSGGLLHTLNPQTGDDMTPPVKLLPPNAKAAGAILIDTTMYVATRDGCGSAANGVYAIDLGSDAKTVTHWESKGGSVAGTAGVTFGTDGNIYVATDGGAPGVQRRQRHRRARSEDTERQGLVFARSDAVHRVSRRLQLQRQGPDRRGERRRQVVRAGCRDRSEARIIERRCRRRRRIRPAQAISWLARWRRRRTPTDRAGCSPRPPDHRVQVRAFGSTNGPVTNGAIVAYKLVDQNGTMGLQAVWASRDMLSPAPPTVVNGVVFAISTGEFRSGDSQLTAAQRAQRGKAAVLWALDAASGKELWSSGNTISSFVRGVGPSAGDGQVYVVTYDGTVYAFGIPLEH